MTEPAAKPKTTRAWNEQAFVDLLTRRGRELGLYGARLSTEVEDCLGVDAVAYCAHQVEVRFQIKNDYKGAWLFLRRQLFGYRDPAIVVVVWHADESVTLRRTRVAMAAHKRACSHE